MNENGDLMKFKIRNCHNCEIQSHSYDKYSCKCEIWNHKPCSPNLLPYTDNFNLL